VVEGQLIRMKVSSTRVKAEHDDLAAAARRTGVPLRELGQRAEAAWLAGHEPLPVGGGDADQGSGTGSTPLPGRSVEPSPERVGGAVGDDGPA
jgi:hypothetical protein